MSNLNNEPVTVSNDTVRDFYHRYVAAANARDFDTIDTLMHDSILLNGQPVQKEEALAAFKWLTDTVPDYVWHIEDLFVDGNRIAARLRDTGTPAKTFFGAEPTGASIDFTEFASYKLRDGLFSEMWYLLDTAKITEQLNK